ncbi:hypothetical protein [Comamonas composti]|uniref:hypothetical protein n=1 Tax=Comamonas composti TaxID=408558 RepID=UPI000416BDC7|nr:hypothetical protein [Comamonas composti]
MWQNIIVGIIVILAAAFLLWRYLPMAWRQRAGRLHPALAPKGGGCGGCSACEGDSCAPDGRR